MPSRDGAGSTITGSGNDTSGIDRLDYHPGRPLRRHEDAGETSSHPSANHSYAGSFFEQVAEGIYNEDRAKMRREVLRYISFIWAIVVWYATMFHESEWTPTDTETVSVLAQSLPFRFTLLCFNSAFTTLSFASMPSRSLRNSPYTSLSLFLDTSAIDTAPVYPQYLPLFFLGLDTSSRHSHTRADRHRV